MDRDDRHYEVTVCFQLTNLVERAFGDFAVVDVHFGATDGESSTCIRIYNNVSERWVEVYGGTIDDTFNWLVKGGM